MTAVKVAKRLMKKFEHVPSADSSSSLLDKTALSLDHPDFLEGSQDERLATMLRSSQSVYEDELRNPWDAYFGIPLKPLLSEQSALDLGCFTGGRAVAWYERYGLASIAGNDVDPVYVEAAQHFAERKGVPAGFELAPGEQLPFADEAFDVVLSFDVFEHVRDPARTLRECRRVLKPGGKLFLVFPGYFHPIEHHLGHVTRIPFIHWLFSGRTLVRAYYELLAERGAAAAWYNRSSPELEPWERGHTINGLTLRAFRRLIEEADLRVVLHSRPPLGAVGRRAATDWRVRTLARLFWLGARLPLLEEVCLHRIVLALEKPS